MKNVNRELVRKTAIPIFIKRKVIEILIVLGIFLLPYLYSKIFYPKICNAGGFLITETKGIQCFLANWIVGTLTLSLLLLVLALIYLWIKGNWEKSVEKAEEKLRKRD